MKSEQLIQAMQTILLADTLPKSKCDITCDTVYEDRVHKLISINVNDNKLKAFNITKEVKGHAIVDTSSGFIYYLLEDLIGKEFEETGGTIMTLMTTNSVVVIDIRKFYKRWDRLTNYGSLTKLDLHTIIQQINKILDDNEDCIVGIEDGKMLDIFH
jgi:hypothetical protein